LPPISTREHAERSPYEPACDECYIAPNPPTACPPASSRDDGATDAAAPADAAAVRAAELAAAARLQLDQQQLDQQQLRQDKLDLEAVVAAASKASFEAAAAIATLEPHNPARAVDDSATRVGLNNPKAVCHLNALLQYSFSTPSVPVHGRRVPQGHLWPRRQNAGKFQRRGVRGGCRWWLWTAGGEGVGGGGHGGRLRQFDVAFMRER